MDDSILDKLSDLTRSLGDGSPADRNTFDELSKNLSGALADIAHQVEDIRQSLVEHAPPAADSLSDPLSASSHLGDINKTISDAADTLFTLTEKAIVDHDRAGELLTSLSGSIGSNGNGAVTTVDELININKESKQELLSVFEALSFQDLAGQKILKINDLIGGVEGKILEILVIMGYSQSDNTDKQDEMLTSLKGNNGPIDQGLVDDILKDFGL